MQETVQKKLFYVFRNMNLYKDAINEKLFLIPMKSSQLRALLLEVVKIMRDKSSF